MLQSVLIVALAVASQSVSTQSAETAVDDVLTGLDDIDATLQGFQVEASVTGRNARMAGTGIEYVDFSATAAYIVDSSGRVRCESDFQRDDQHDSDPKRRVAVYDGEVVRAMDGRNGFDSGDVFRQKERVFFHGLDPRIFVTQIRDRPAAEYLRERNASLARHETWQGREVLVLETEPLNSADKQWMTRAFVEPARGFSLVRVAECYRFTPEDPWQEYITIETFDHIQDASGVWLPTRVVREGFATPVDREHSPKLLRAAEFAFQNWALNPEIPENVFTLDYPPGVIVDDEIEGRTFKTAEITDQMVADQAAFARTVQEPQEKEALGLQRNAWLVAAASLAMLALGLLFVWRWQRRNR